MPRHDDPSAPPPLDTGFARLTDSDPRDLDRHEAGNGLIHMVSLSLTKAGDSLIDPKLVLSWLLTVLGAPGMVIGALVPVREAGALLPQLALARQVERAAQRKRIWAAGAVVQGLAALGIAAAVLMLEGAAAGWSVLALVAVLAVARSAASVSYKDVLARTIAKGRRGAVTGFAATVASVAAFGFGLSMALGLFDVAVPVLAGAVALAGVAFLLAGGLFLRLREPAHGDHSPQAEGIAALIRPLREDRQLQVFVAARAALTVTALAPPFIVMLSSAGGEGALDQLGPMVMASTAAAVLSSYVWGRLSDRSSRQTLVIAGGLAALVLLLIGLAGLLLGGLGGAWGAGLAIFAAQIAYEGVRQGRKLHLTDMAEDDFRARYTALSNTLIGAALMAGGLFGLAADYVGPAILLVVFAVISAIGAAIAARLDEVQQD
ncbi:MAG: MFS transporter [Paracoccaceae bacterium]